MSTPATLMVNGHQNPLKMNFMKHIVLPSQKTERTADISNIGRLSTVGNYNHSNNGTFFLSIEKKPTLPAKNTGLPRCLVDLNLPQRMKEKKTLL